MDFQSIINSLRSAGTDERLLRQVADLATGALPDEGALVASVVAEFNRLEPLRTTSSVEGLEALAAVHEALKEHQEKRRSTVMGTPVTKPALPPIGSANKFRPAGNRPGAGRQSARTSFDAAVATAMTAAGRPVVSPRDLAEHAAEELRRLKPGESRLVASARWSYPEERRLGADPQTNAEIIEAAVSPQALAASGGVCGPVAVDYSILVASVQDRPVASALPSFEATRGGLRFMQPPTFAGVGSSATAIWTEATDAAPGNLTKPVQTIVCGQEVEVYVDAIPTRLKFGNMQARFSPEMVEANTTLALANAARVQDLALLSKIATASTSVSSGQLLGAARDLMATLDQALAAYRFRSRIPRSLALRVMLPEWAIDLIRADMTRSTAHGDDSALAVTDAQINAWFAARNVTVSWFLDGQPASTSGIAYPLQGWGAQSPGLLLGWPSALVWYVYAEGTFQRLDGGTLDLAVVRDSILDGTNDYETFIEIFEGLAMRGFESLQVISQVRPNGASAAPIADATPSVY